MAQQEDGNIYKVEAFKEKPNLEIAQEYLAAGNYLWNAGIFVWNVKTLIEGITAYAPQIAGKLNELANYFDAADERAGRDLQLRRQQTGHFQKGQVSGGVADSPFFAFKQNE